MQYHFFRASLPVLEQNVPAPLTVAEFDEMAQEELTAADFAALTSFDGVPGRDAGECCGKPGVYSEIIRFEQYLRSLIARRRGGAGIPELSTSFSEADYAVTAAAAAGDPVVREQIVDRLRWGFLDDLELMHDFDLTALCIYRIRLFLLNKLRGRSVEDGRSNFDLAAARICGIQE